MPSHQVGTRRWKKRFGVRHTVAAMRRVGTTIIVVAMALAPRLKRR